jgi:hypothetical protein
MRTSDFIVVAVLLGAAWWHLTGGKLPDVLNPAPTVKATSIHLIYEKDEHNIPSPVLAALNQLNRRGIVATTFDDDVVDGTGEVPAQYKIALEESRKSGLPVLVVQAGDEVVKVVKNPTTEQAVLEAVGP